MDCSICFNIRGLSEDSCEVIAEITEVTGDDNESIYKMKKEYKVVNLFKQSQGFPLLCSLLYL